MRASAAQLHRPARFALVALASVLSLSLLVLVLAPQAQAKKSYDKFRAGSGMTTLTTDPATTSLLFGAGIIPLPVAPTTITPTSDAAQYTFPVTYGKLDLSAPSGYIKHSGGLLLAQRDGMAWKALSLTKFTISVTNGNLTAIVNGGDRLAIADLDLSSATIMKYKRHGRTYVSIKNVGVNLNETAVGAINATYMTDLTAPVALGTADVLLKGKAHWRWNWWR
jgi:hypothetical protein